MYKVIFSDRALLEVEVSWSWYEDRESGLGDKFKKALNKSVETILKSPDRYPVKFTDYREMQMKKYPFVIVYKIMEALGVLLITSVFHTKRNPQNKYRL